MWCRSLYKIMISGIVPRPVAFVSSSAAYGTENIAPFRYGVILRHYKFSSFPHVIILFSFFNMVRP